MFSRLLIYFLRKPAVAKVIREIAHQPSETEIQQSLSISLNEFEALLARIVEQRSRRAY